MRAYGLARLGISLLLFLTMVQVGYGQTKVYATNYGAAQSGAGGLFLDGLVRNPQNAIEPNSTNSNYTELFIGNGLLGNAHATYQIEFLNIGGNLSGGTSIYIRLDDNVNGGLLGLALASNNVVTAYSNANSGNTFTLTGNNVPLIDSDIVPIQIGGAQYLRVTPSECFNAIRLSIGSGGLLGLLATGNIRVYHAYYECPTITVPPPTICSGQTTTLQIDNPITSCGEYMWYDSPTNGTLIGAGASYNTGALSETTTFYVEHSNVDNSTCGRTPVVVTVNPLPTIDFATIPAICEGDVEAILAYSATTNGANQYSITWDGSPVGFSNVTNTALPTSSITLTIPASAALGVYTGILTVRNSTTGCESEEYPFSLTINPRPGKPHMTITDVQN